MPVLDPQSRRILFVSTRFSGTDGVSLETEKWTDILQEMGHACFFAAGEIDRPEEVSEVIPEMHFKHPEVAWINEQCFEKERRTRELGDRIEAMTTMISDKLEAAIARFRVDLLIVENAITIPMNIPLGLAIVKVVMESGIGCIAHHHDFVWERERFLVTAAEDFLAAAFPPPLSIMQHIAINSRAARDFSRRTGLSCRVIPNIMDFDHPPLEADAYAAGFREAIGLTQEDILILQPTRIVHRKGIEHAVELLYLLKNPRAKLVITHASGDEGDRYARRIRRYADALKVPVIFADEWITQKRGTRSDGKKLFTLEDAYSQADFVTYPSSYEGFGNAFLEAVYFKKPLLCNRYAIYRTDIQPCGFDVVLMDGFLDDDVVEQVKQVIEDPDRRLQMVERNYEVARNFFSFRRARNELEVLLAKPSISCME